MGKTRPKSAGVPKTAVGPKSGVIDIVLLALPLIALISVKTFAGPCTHADGTVGVCAAAANNIVWVSLAAGVAAFVRLLAPSRVIKLALSAIIAVLGLVIILMPGTIMPLCSMETMQCQAMMKPTMMIFGALILVAGIVCTIFGVMQVKNPGRYDAA